MANGADLAIDLEDVAKTYRGNVQALKGIAMSVHRGEIFGLLGPNGAGKSTLVKILMTVISASRCKGTMLGKPVGDKGTLARVGYLPEHHRFPDYLTGRQVLHYYGALQHVPAKVRNTRIDGLLELVGMERWADRRIKSYSKGMRQRIGVAQTLIADPDLVLLDEPTDGVDPVGRRDIRNVLTQMREQGKTVFINSHLLSELEMVCDRVAILVGGEVTTEGTISQLTATRGHRIEVKGAAPAWVGEDDVIKATNGTCAFAVSAATSDEVQATIDRLRSEGRVIERLEPLRETLEDLFMRTVTDPETGKASGPGAAIGGDAA